MCYNMERFQWFIDKSDIAFKQHQYDGVAWCIDNENRIGPKSFVGGNMEMAPSTAPNSKQHITEQIGGGFIADEMGLGKTITMIGTIIVNFPAFRNTLIVLPPALIVQWESEIIRTTGHHPILYYGTNAKKNITIDQLRYAPIVLTSYNAVAISLKNINDESKESLLHKMKWDRVVFDEAHHLRNKTSRYFGAKKLISRAKWLMSGTPIQNNHTDFYNLCSIVGLQSSFFKDKNMRNTLLNDYMLKRTKNGIGIELLPINTQYRLIDWEVSAERVLSEEIHRAVSMAGKKDRLKMYQHARQVCILPELICYDHKQVSYMRQSDYLPQTTHFYENAMTYSSKLDTVVRDINSRKGNGNGKIVFCHFRKEIDILMERLIEMGVNSIAAIDGRTSNQRTRKNTMETGYEVLILQIQTGCEGLNLQKNYSEVYFTSPHWNPMIEDQAIARCHRIGQTKQVVVFRYGMKDVVDQKRHTDPHVQSMDHYINGIQTEKRDIANEMLLTN